VLFRSGGFATPLARSLAEEVIIVVGHDRQSLYAANNIATAAKYFQSMGGSTQILGLIVNRDDGTDTADNFAEAIGLPILTRVPLNHDVRVLADSCKLALEVDAFDDIFGDLAHRIQTRAIQPCKTFEPLNYREFLNVFNAYEPNGAPVAATDSDLFGESQSASKPYLPDIDLMPARQVNVIDPTLRAVQDAIEAIGVHVTGLEDDKDDGITVTSGAVEIRIGGTDDLIPKTAFLSALLRTGQVFSLIDVRHVDAPTYR
jgi:3,8-divinyl chlorophyllide a/chlorophyllide a reductase subunit X